MPHLTEWRVCGEDAQRGPWRGAWRAEPSGGISAREMYDVRQYAHRNDRVWIERRTVTYGPTIIEEVHADAAREGGSDAR